jgi:hypothetical protein
VNTGIWTAFREVLRWAYEPEDYGTKSDGGSETIVVKTYPAPPGLPPVKFAAPPLPPQAPPGKDSPTTPLLPEPPETLVLPKTRDGPSRCMIPPPPPPPPIPPGEFAPVAIRAPALLIEVLEARISIPPALASEKGPATPAAEIDPVEVMTILPAARIVMPPPEVLA